MAIRFGLIGSGYINRGYAAGLHIGQVPDGKLVAIAGGRRAPALAEEFGVESEPSVPMLLARDDIDAVIIGSPHTAHLPQTVMAAAAGKHVYVEKPMAVTVNECDQMIEICRSSGVKLSVNKVLRFRIAPSAAKELIDSGVIGDVRMIQARGSWTEFFLPGRRGRRRPNHHPGEALGDGPGRRLPIPGLPASTATTSSAGTAAARRPSASRATTRTARRRRPTSPRSSCTRCRTVSSPPCS